MAKTDHLDLLNQERQALRETLAHLRAEERSRPSFCERWTVEDVACHVASWPHRFGSFQNAARFSLLLARTGSMDTVNQRYLDEWKHKGFDRVLTELACPRPRGSTDSGLEAELAELFIHAQDIRRALGVPHRLPEDGLVAVLTDCVAESSWAGEWTKARPRTQGLSLRATDLEWSHGAGPQITGPAEAIIMAAHGRGAALGELDGPGLATLAARLSHPEVLADPPPV